MKSKMAVKMAAKGDVDSGGCPNPQPRIETK